MNTKDQERLSFNHACFACHFRGKEIFLYPLFPSEKVAMSWRCRLDPREEVFWPSGDRVFNQPATLEFCPSHNTIIFKEWVNVAVDNRTADQQFYNWIESQQPEWTEG